jgi:hypothetical protein
MLWATKAGNRFMLHDHAVDAIGLDNIERILMDTMPCKEGSR